MSFAGSLGLSFGKSKSSSTSTTTPNNPAWVSDLASTLGGQIGSITSRDPYSFVAGTNPLLERAFGQALGTDDPNGESVFDKALKYAEQGAKAGASSASAGSLLDGLDKYMSKYTKDVVESALADFDYGAGKTRAGLDLEMANGAFGGSGSALARSMTEESLGRARASTSANLYDQAFNTATGLSDKDAQRRTDVSIANAQLAEQANARRINGGLALGGLAKDQIGVLSELGDYRRQMDQSYLKAPLELAGWGVGQLASIPYADIWGVTQKSKGKNTNFGVTAEIGGSKA